MAGEVVVIAIQASGARLATLFPSWPPAIADLNIGIVALIVNVAVMLAVSGVTRPRAVSDREA